MSKQRQFPEDKDYRGKRLVSSTSKRNRYITKLEKVIKTVTDLTDCNRDINDVNKANESLESVISKIRKTTNDILRDKLDDKIKEMDLKVFTNSEFKVIQVRNCIESYIETKFKPAKADNLPETPHKASVAEKSCHSDSLQQSVNGKQNLILDRNRKSSKSSSKSSSSSSSKLESIPHESPSLHTSYFSLERRKTSEFNELLAEQSKQRIHRKLKILEKSFELQKEQLLEEAFEAESQA